MRPVETLDPAPMTLDYADDATRWAAVQARDAMADGAFFYAVRTTGVVCRPSCAARPALRANVSFHASVVAAVAAGFRPCKRCRPDEPPKAERNAAIVAKACQMIEDSDETPLLEEVARSAGLSPHHFHRLFRAVTGLTPKAWADAHRGRKLRQELEQSRTVTEAIYDAGFNSSGRFYAASDALLGMTPGAFRKGGAQVAIRFAVGQCSLGAVLAATSDRGVCAILLGEDPDALVKDLQDRFPRAELIGADPAFEAVVAQVVAMVEQPQLGLDLPLDVRGTAFQQRVWRALRDIPAGETRSYAQIAQAMGAPKSHRAVAMACGGNALAIAIPCHRVVRSDGALSGYRWGVERKRALLAREAKA